VSSKLTRRSYEQMIAEDIAWLQQFPDTLERDHIERVLKASPEHEYGQPPSDERVVWCAAYGAAYANAVQERQRRGEAPLPKDGETEDLMTVGDCAVEAWQKARS
jgi:hypothetical protein